MDRAGQKREITGMNEDTFSARLARIIKERGLTKQAAADLCGVKYHALNAVLIRENAVPNAQIANQIANGLGVQLDWLLTGRNKVASPVAVAGQVGAGARVPLVDMYAKGDGLYHVARPPQLAGQSVVAVEVEGDSMAPVYEPGTVLFYCRDAMGVPTEALGRICVCEDADGLVWVKQVKTGSVEGTFSLISVNPTSDTMHGVRLRWAAPVRFSLPPEFVERI